MATKRYFKPGPMTKYRYRASPLNAWRPWTDLQFGGSNGESRSISHSMPITGTGDQGGPWWKFSTENYWGLGQLTSGTFEGHFGVGAPKDGTIGIEMAVEPSNASLDALGTTAIARCEPTNPVFSASTAIGEVAKDGLPSVIGVQAMKEQTNIARKAGGEYLNHQFGWLPLVSDVKKLLYAVDNSERILAAYHKGSSQKYRRGFSYPSESQQKMYTGQMLPIPSNAITSFVTGGFSDQVSKDVWFDGAFRYHIPTSTGQIGKFQGWASDVRKLYGIELTPEVVWNLAPWSWAADWFSNTGDVLHNISALGRDGMVMQYGYVMHHSRRERIRYGSLFGQSLYHRYITDRKLRRPATPYGFGVDLQALSAKQTAVLVALGLSRVG